MNDEIKSLIVILGLSGSGKSIALRALEDIGYNCVENLPVSLIPSYLQLVSTSGNTDNFCLLPHTDSNTYDLLAPAIKGIDSKYINLEILFLDTVDEILVRRFRESRRPHPYTVRNKDCSSLVEAINSERLSLRKLQSLATKIIDTSFFLPQELRKSVQTFAYAQPKLEVEVVSFGFSRGLPLDADLVFDVRFLPNPHYVSGLRELTGLSDDVSDYVMSFPEAQEIVSRLSEMIAYLIPQYINEGKRYLTVGIGCTGGRHRSVTVVRQLVSFLEGADLKVDVTSRHRDIDK